MPSIGSINVAVQLSEASRPRGKEINCLSLLLGPSVMMASRASWTPRQPAYLRQLLNQMKRNRAMSRCSAANVLGGVG